MIHLNAKADIWAGRESPKVHGVSNNSLVKRSSWILQVVGGSSPSSSTESEIDMDSTKEIAELVKRVGMSAVLNGLIAHTVLIHTREECYLERLLEDLRHSKKRYEDRYSGEDTGT